MHVIVFANCYTCEWCLYFELLFISVDPLRSMRHTKVQIEYKIYNKYKNTWDMYEITYPLYLQWRMDKHRMCNWQTVTKNQKGNEGATWEECVNKDLGMPGFWRLPIPGDEITEWLYQGRLPKPKPQSDYHSEKPLSKITHCLALDILVPVITTCTSALHVLMYLGEKNYLALKFIKFKAWYLMVAL